MTINILVPVKRVVDANLRVRVSSNGSIDTTGLKMSLNPFDECAVEKALQLREAGVASKVTVITCGTRASQDVLRTALAMGADDAVLIDTATATSMLDSLAVARLLNAYMATREYGLVLCGKQAIDGEHRRCRRHARRPARLAAGIERRRTLGEWHRLVRHARCHAPRRLSAVHSFQAAAWLTEARRI